MAVATMTMEIGGPGPVPAKLFASALQELLEALAYIDGSLAPACDAPVSWTIAHLSMGSPITVELAPCDERLAERSGRAASMLAAAVEALTNGATDPPLRLPRSALEHTSELVALVDSDITAMRLRASGEEWISVSVESAQVARRLLRRSEHTEYGTIEGRIETLSIRGRRAFYVWDVVSGHRVECGLGGERGELLDEAHRAFGKRVAVSGLIRYRGPNEPQSITVDGITVLREADDLPRVSDYPPIDITGGVDAVTYVRGLRDAD
jgi:hypothetical protein